MQNLRDIKNYVNEIYTRTYNMEQKLNQGGQQIQQQQGGQTGTDQTVRTYLDAIQNDVRHIRSSMLANQPVGGAQPVGGCPACVTTWTFILFGIFQGGIILAFIFVR